MNYLGGINSEANVVVVWSWVNSDVKPDGGRFWESIGKASKVVIEGALRK